MKEVALEQLSAETSKLLDCTEQQNVLITRDGKPFAVIMRVEHTDAEDFQLQTSADFWRMIEERRRSPSIPLEQLKAELFPNEPQAQSATKDK
jgi:prevent-host-death family protein